MNAPEQINWPDGLSAQLFLDKHWQKTPLLLQQAFVDFQTPISPDELAGLSLEEDTTPRLITLDANGQYQLEHGPFDEDRFESLKSNDWSLLVTDVEKHCPELVHYLKPFQFIPGWRIDDLMISYAPEGASVGAHVDEYDVFLLQASGTREWLIDSGHHPDLSVVPDATLKVLQNFTANERHELNPGDMLYLPPGVPHHGIAASDNCTTWSIGFRAPVLSDVVLSFAELIAERMGTERYTDPALRVSTPGLLDAQSLQAFSTLWKQAVDLSNDELSRLTAQTLTTPTTDVERDVFQESELIGTAWRKHPFSRFAFLDETSDDTSDKTGGATSDRSSCDLDDAANGKSNSSVLLFADGQMWTCSKQLAIRLCDNQSVAVEELDKTDAKVLLELMLNGTLVPDD